MFEQSSKLLSFNQTFCPLGIICPCPWAIYMYKIVYCLFSETAWAIFTRFHMGPSVEMVLPICSNSFAPVNNIAAMPIYGKNIFWSFPEPRKLWDWILVYSIKDLRSTRFVQMMTASWPTTFLRQGQICVPMYLYWNVEKSFTQNVLKTNGWNLQCVIKVVNHFSSNKNFVP